MNMMMKCRNKMHSVDVMGNPVFFSIAPPKTSAFLLLTAAAHHLWSFYIWTGMKHRELDRLSAQETKS